MLSKKVIIYPDNSICIEGKMYSAPPGFFEKYGIPLIRTSSNGRRLKGAEIIRRDQMVFVCHYLPQPKGPRRETGSKPATNIEALPKAHLF